LDLETNKIALTHDKQWRQAANPEGADTFEVYRGFFPQENGDASTTILPQRSAGMIIYVGFNMAAIENAVREDTRNTIIIALVLLLIGSSAIVSLFLVQAYRMARSSLSRITVFSEALVKNMPVGLIALDEAGNIAVCNEKAGAILNIGHNDALGKHVSTVLSAPLQDILAALPAAGGLIEKDLQLTDGKVDNKLLEIVAAGLTVDDTSAGKIILLRDVTAIRQLESEVAKSRHLNSLASLAAGVAHEIRNPLSSIKGFAVYFKERLSGNIDDEKTADTLIREVERLNRVISQLIEFARPLELKREKVHFPELLQHALLLIAAEAKNSGVTVSAAPPPDLPPLEVDPDKVKQVLLNIFLNALAAMKQGGNLRVKLMPEKDNLTVIISDTGAGIEKTDLPRIYDPYFTSKPTGTGLGLAVVQKIMEAHGGRISVESNVGRGTDVFLQFPLASA